MLTWHCLLLPSCPIVALWKISNIIALNAEGACRGFIDVELPLCSPTRSDVLSEAA